MNKVRMQLGKGAASLVLVLLTGCVAPTGSSVLNGATNVSKNALGFIGLGGEPQAAPQVGNTLSGARAADVESPVFDNLLNRRSVLADGALNDVANAVLDANSRAAEADLRAARLRSEAQQKNWLPTIGPNVSLSSLGGVVASLIVEQTIFDNGRKAAERQFAKADVEVAAVALAEDSNERVRQALDLYLKAEAARARSRVNGASLDRMRHFEYIMTERVRGGVSNRADLLLVQQKRNQMESDLSSDKETAATARAELDAMSAYPMSGVTGLSDVNAPASNAVPLAVLRAEAEAGRDVANAKAQRAGLLPGVKLSGSAGTNGPNVGLNAGSANVGFGTGASLAALDAKAEGAGAHVNQQREDSNRRLASLDAQITALIRQSSEAKTIASQAAVNYNLFSNQLEAGQRSVPEVVGVFETKVRAEREAVNLAYDLARLQVQRAALLGTLVDGDRI